ncbi:MAG: DUF1073 domain-containing protein [Bradymonadaceae bacterium]
MKQRLDAISNFLTLAEGQGRHDSISNYLSSLGDPTKDSGASGRPTLDTRLMPHELETLYLGSDLAGIIVDEIVDEAFREGYAVAVDDDDETTDPAAEWTKNLCIPEVVSRAVKWGRLYGGGFVLMVLDDGLDPAAPVNLDAIQDVTALVDLDRWEVTPHRWQTNILLPGFGEPDLYTLSPQTEGGAVEGLGNASLVHASRLLRFGGVELPRQLKGVNSGYDDSVLQRPWDAMRRFVESEQAMARIVQSYEVTTIGMAGLAKVMQDDDGADLIHARMQLLAKSLSIINAYLLDTDAGETLMRQSSSVTGLAELRDRFAESVSKAARMPQTILFGTAPAGLNTDGESGIQSWHKRVKALQTHGIEPQLERLYRILFRAKKGPTKGTEPKGWGLNWRALDEPGEKEQAETRFTVAQTDAIYLDRGVRTPDQVAASRDGSAGWSMETVAPDEDLSL